MIAAYHGQVDTVRCPVKEFGADVSIATNEGEMALIVAAQNGHLGDVQRLVKELDADVNLTTNDGSTALMVASHGKHTKGHQMTCEAWSRPKCHLYARQWS
jgi:ankyrin repeat protein